jgi:ankyrin repeat protein
VLKGETLDDRDRHFSKNGNRSVLHRTNPVASNSWQQLLENKSPDDNQPLQWCKVMTQAVPENRIKADALWKKIYTCQDKFRYFPICCDENQTVCDDEKIHEQATIHQPEPTTPKPNSSDARLKPSSNNKNLTVSSRGPTPNDEIRLFDAAKKGNLVMVTLLYQQGSNIEARDSKGRTPMIMAAEYGNSTIITYLLNSGADIDAQDKDGWNALHYAAFFGSFYSCQELLKRGLDLETQSNEGSCALHLAVQGGEESIVRMLLEAGADINRETFAGWTALMDSAK